MMTQSMGLKPRWSDEELRVLRDSADAESARRELRRLGYTRTLGAIQTIMNRTDPRGRCPNYDRRD